MDRTSDIFLVFNKAQKERQEKHVYTKTTTKLLSIYNCNLVFKWYE